MRTCAETAAEARMRGCAETATDARMTGVDRGAAGRARRDFPGLSPVEGSPAGVCYTLPS